MSQYYMPTKVITGKGCIYEHRHLLNAYGKKAMIVTGKRSAKLNGSQEDVVRALEAEGIGYVLYDKVMSNPTIDCAYEGASLAKSESVDFVIAIGGGSPIDAAKAMALISKNDIEPSELFKGNFGEEALPIIAIPTTAGTGSEVTQYSILTNDAAETKSGLATPLIFPKIAFLDATYMMGLSSNITINTGIDALSHAVEGMMSVRANEISNTLAIRSIGMIMSTVETMIASKKKDDLSIWTYEQREALLVASMLAGMVIAQTGTTAVHAMGYSLTYFKDIDHGRANGLLLGHYMKLVNQEKPAIIDCILKAMNLKDLRDYESVMAELLGQKEVITDEEIEKYSAKAIGTGNIKNSVVQPTQAQLITVYKNAFAIG